MIMVRRFLILALCAIPTGLAAQSSQFGTRGFGLPLRPISVRAAGTGGGFGLFDIESSLNPAALGLASQVNAAFQTVQTWTSTTNPLGTASTSDNRFPGFSVTAPIGGVPLSMGISASGYTDRNFQLASRDTLILREVPVEVLDTLTSLGGISDLRAAIAWRQSPRFQLGVGLHLLTGSNRITSHRVFTDSAYTGATEVNTISYLALGVSAGVTVRPVSALTLAGMIRADDGMRVEQDTTRLGTVKLPMTLAGGARLQLGSRMLLAGSTSYRNWSRSNGDLLALGGAGSRSTLEWNAGFEFTPDPNRPGLRPIRMGVYHSELPFAIQTGVLGSETGVSAGTSLDFARSRARADLALSHVWRSASGGFSERAFLVNLGVSIRP